MDAFEKWWVKYGGNNHASLTTREARCSAMAAYSEGKAEGVKEGMRRAAEIAKQQNDENAENLRMGKGTWPQKDYIRDEIWHHWEGQEQASRWIANAILKEAGE